MNQDYHNHHIFKQLKQYSEFYDDLAGSASDHTKTGMETFNLDAHAFMSIQGTLDSIHDTLEKGRIGDAFALLRKYYDATIVNIYANLLLEDYFNPDTWSVDEVRQWVLGKAEMPKGSVNKYIRDARQLADINSLFQDTKPKEIRDRANNYVHYNYYDNFVLNANEIFLGEERVKQLNFISDDIEYIFIRHLACIFTLSEEYMGSSDYVDMLDAGQKPEEGSQYWVAPYIQQIFDQVIKAKRPDVAGIIKEKTSMCLD